MEGYGKLEVRGAREWPEEWVRPETGVNFQLGVTEKGAGDFYLLKGK